MSVTKASAARSVLWATFENGGLAAISFGCLVVYARFLSPADFGLFSVVLAIVELLNIVVSSTFHDVLIQRDDIETSHFDTAFTVSLGLSVVLVALCFAFGGMFSRAMGNPSAGAVLGATALSLPFNAIAAGIVPIQRRHLQFRALAMRSLVGRVFGAVVGIVLVIRGAHFWGLVAQYVLMSTVGALALWVAAIQRPRIGFRRRDFRALAGFGALSVGGLFLDFAVSRIFTVLAGVSIGAQAAGFMNLSFRAADVLWGFASSALNQAALPVLARLQSDRPRFRQAYFSALQFATLILYPCFVGLAVTAPEVVQVVFGRVWAPSAPYVTMVALLVLFRVPRHLSRPVLTAVGVPQGSLIGSAVELMVIVAGFAVLRPQSLPLVMTIWVAREILVAPVSAAVLARVSGFGILDQVRATLPAGQASAVTAVGVILTRMFLVPASWPGMIRLLLLSIIGAFAFCATAWLVEPLAVRGIFSFFASAVRRPKVEAPSQS